MINPFACMRRLLGALILGLGAAAAQSAPPMYRITMVPPLPGYISCWGVGLNDVGQVAGNCGYDSFIWSTATGLQPISDPAFPQHLIYLTAINNAGVVTGSRYENVPFAPSRAFVWDAVNGFTYFGRDNRVWAPQSINDSGQVVGETAPNGDTTFPWKAFRWSAAGGIDFLLGGPLAPNTRTFASDINNAGQIAVAFENFEPGIPNAALLEPNGGLTRLLPGRRWNVATALNDQDHAVGFMQVPPGSFRAFLWTPSGGAQLIDTRTNRGDDSYASDLNAADQVVGAMWFIASNGDYTDLAFYWDAENGMRDLFTLLDPSDPLYGQVTGLLSDNVKINAHGQIQVNGWGLNGLPVPLLLTPLP
jgi:hypothetical protein